MTWTAPSFTTRPDLTGTFGMSASTHWVASSTAQAVLERGGNAFDAAVAAGFVLHIVEPHLNGPGGDLVGIIAPSGAKHPLILMGQGPAPHGATMEHFAAEGLDLIPGSGALAAAIPGAVEAWLMLLEDYGSWELEDVLQFAIHYATVGHPALPTVAATISAVSTMFTEHWPSSAAQWMPEGRAPRAGEVIRNEAYAATLTRLIAAAKTRAGEHGSRRGRIEGARLEWREGFVAEEIDAFVSSSVHRHSPGSDHRGVIDRTDLAGFIASYESPVTLEFRGTTIWKAGAWSQGPSLLQALAILDGFTDDEIDPSTAGGIHRIVEALKLALADRDAFYRDGLPDDQLAVLLSPEYAAERRALITEVASLEMRPGTALPDPYLPRLSHETGTELDPLMAKEPSTGEPTVSPRGASADSSTGEPTVAPTGETRGDTCHVDVVDRWGNAASITPSGGWLQSSPTIPNLGFALGSRLQMFWLDDDSPSKLDPGKRPRTTLSPTVLSRNGRVVSALGTPGGDQQDQWQLLYLLRTLVGRMSPQQAIDAPAFHTTGFAESFWPRGWTRGGLVVEGRVGQEIIADLEARGHVVTVAGDWALGRLSAVTRDPDTHLLGAAGNPRGGQGYAVGR